MQKCDNDRRVGSSRLRKHTTGRMWALQHPSGDGRDLAFEASPSRFDKHDLDANSSYCRPSVDAICRHHPVVGEGCGARPASGNQEVTFMQRAMSRKQTEVLHDNAAN